MAHISLSPEQLFTLAPTANRNIVDGIIMNAHQMPVGYVDSPLRLCHFMAQIAHESAHFHTTREYASGAAYEGRKDLGNIYPGDGRRYPGRALIQVTGRHNHREMTGAIRRYWPSLEVPDFEAQPEKLEEFPWALLASLAFWRRHEISKIADTDDVVRVTRVINGGTNGLADRQRLLRSAKNIWLGLDPGESGHKDLSVGDRGDRVKELQRMLNELGWHLAEDGIFGWRTRAALRNFQRGVNITASGVFDAQTRRRLSKLITPCVGEND